MSQESPVESRWTASDFEHAVSSPHWGAFVAAVDLERDRRYSVYLAAEAERLAASMDMTPEGYVREWNRRGRRNVVPLAAWEQAYHDAWMIDRAESMGYISIGRDVACTVRLKPLGEALLRGDAETAE